ncbi:MAG: acyltransferase [Acidobacteria bacterium]|nr:acyltransferase [Acidobacteriota bacterium]
MTNQAVLPSKNHYKILDGLRGVAALVVVLFHSFEMYAGDDPYKFVIGHGYLAVDFFFLLSGFVVAYAYDDRWGRMTQWDFYKRRLVRLQPMVILGNIIGAVLFYLQAGAAFPVIATTPAWKMLLVMFVGFTVIPILPSMDIRGWQEMHPLDGPEWTLFFEYIANILYALVLRKLPNKIMGILVALAAIFLIHLTVMGPRGDVIGGWSVTPEQLHIGFARLLFPFLAGILLMRLHKRIHVPGAFAWCSLILVVFLAIPRVGPPQHTWMNGLYESFCIIVVFPIILLMGAGSDISGKMERVCKFAGDLSYPLYISHYPLNYTYTVWVNRHHVPLSQGAPISLLVVCVNVAVGYACLKLYDEPVRAWLTRRFLPKKAA